MVNRPLDTIEKPKMNKTEIETFMIFSVSVWFLGKKNT